jgi:hypothetical protein
MSQTDITISFQLQVQADNTIIIPGCEPTTAISSAALSYSLALNGCEHPKVPVNLILEKIPGTYLKYGWDFNLGYNQTWLVFPPYYTGCPCPFKPDWYDMLRCIAKDIPESVSPEIPCDLLEREFCNPEIPVGGGEPDSLKAYQNPPEGPSALGYGGILPPIPPWAKKTVNFCKLAGMNENGNIVQDVMVTNLLDSILD